MANKDQLRKEAAGLGIDVDDRWSEATLQRKINEKREPGDPANHEPAQTAETANAAGEETEADRVAERKNDDGRTAPIDYVKNTGPGPGNPDQRVVDPKALTASAAVADPVVIAGPAIGDDGKKLKTEETPKVIHETVSAEGAREYTNNVIPDQSKRSPLVVQAEAYGIYVHPDWSDDRIRGELQMALEGRADLQVKGAVPPKDMGKEDYDAQTRAVKVPVTLNGDFWDEDGNRHSKGSKMEMTTAEAKKLIASGAATRADPLPGE